MTNSTELDRKICSGCKEPKELSSFSKDKYKKSELRSRCKTCINVYNTQYSERFRDRERERSREYNRLNPEKRAQWYKDNPNYNADYYASNREAVTETNLIWLNNNRDKSRTYKQNYRYKSRELGKMNPDTLRMLKSIYGDFCLFPLCGVSTGLHIDHVVPLSWEGSSNSITNLQLLCKTHNCSKGNRTDSDYRCQNTVEYLAELINKGEISAE